MEQKKQTTAVLAEKDPGVARTAAAQLNDRSYGVAAATTLQGLMDLLKASLVPIALVGQVEGSGSPFETLKEVVMASPMTSIILITDASAEEVDEEAEGYGILGHVGMDVPVKDLGGLLDNFEKIRQALG